VTIQKLNVVYRCPKDISGPFPTALWSGFGRSWKLVGIRRPKFSAMISVHPGNKVGLLAVLIFLCIVAESSRIGLL